MKVATRIMTGAAILGAGLASCTSTGVECTKEAPWSVVVTVVDSITSLNAAPGATLILTKPGGEVEGTMVGPTAFPQLYTGDEAGTFDVSVSKPNFQTWTRAGVVVPLDACNKPATVTLLTRLVRAS
jgi:hypothetical protein